MLHCSAAYRCDKRLCKLPGDLDRGKVIGKVGHVSVSKRRNWILGGIALVAALVIFAWIDGGRRAPREISQPVDLPEAAR